MNCKNITKLKEVFNRTLVNWKTDLLDLKLKEGTMPICSRKYPVPKVHEEISKNSLHV